MERVNVLMSTYNGIKFIKEQIDSILNQKDVFVNIYIRDDGSTDGTYEYITNNYEDIIVMRGENVGYKKSFLKLMDSINEPGYYAFADQDDYWEAEKLVSAIKILKNLDQNKPLLYCSNLTVTDENLNFISYLHKENEFIVSNKYCALVENISYGCTSVFNSEAKEMASRHLPDNISHDGWLNLICTYFGNVYYDPNSYISYRQHGKNVLGGKRDIVSVWIKRLSTFDYKSNIRDVAANEFLSVFNKDLSEEDKELIKLVSEYRKSLKNRIKLLLNNDIKMSTFDRDFWYRVRILFSCI